MNQNQGNPSWQNWSILILLTMVWGTSFILIKKGLVSFSGLQVGALRIGIAFLVFLPYAVRAIRRIPAKYMWYILAIGLFSSFFPSFLIPMGQVHTESSTAGILISLTPLSTYLWGVVVFHQTATKRRSLGVLIGLVGAASLMIDPSSHFGINESALLIFLATIMYGISGNIVHRHLIEVRSTDITALSFGMIGLPAVVYLFTTDFMSIMESGKEAWVSLGAVSILSIIGTAMALLLFWRLVQQTDPVFSSTTTYLIPVVAIMWGLLDGEKILIYQFFGFLLILASIFLVQKDKQKKLNLS